MYELVASVNVGIAAAYVVIGAAIVPQLRLRGAATALGAAFFLTCALTHVELAAHALSEQPAWMISSHMLAIHVTQVAVDWGFIVAMAPWRRGSRSRLAQQIDSYLAGAAAVTPAERRLVKAVVEAGERHDATLEEIDRALEGVAEQRRLDRQKQELVAFASHELRGPAAVLHGAAETLAERWDDLSPERRRELVGLLAGQGARLKRVTDGLLDLSRHDTGSLAVQTHPVLLGEALRAIVDGEVALDVPAGLRVEADEQALERIVGNLVANARRYGREPITVSAARHDGTVVVAVEDRGDGVPAAFVPALFGRFTRADDAAGAEGAGLGLAIAAAYADALGAELRYVPAEPRGARFELRLPVAEEPAPAAASAAPAAIAVD